MKADCCQDVVMWMKFMSTNDQDCTLTHTYTRYAGLTGQGARCSARLGDVHAVVFTP